MDSAMHRGVRAAPRRSGLASAKRRFVLGVTIRLSSMPV
jgi:hypothetical protein